MNTATTTQSSTLEQGSAGITNHLVLLADHGTWTITSKDAAGRARVLRTLTVTEAIDITGRRDWVLSHTRNAIATLGHQLADGADITTVGRALHTLRVSLAAAQN